MPTANYIAEKLTADSTGIVRLTDSDHRIEVSICPSIGNIAYDMRAKGQPILMPPELPLDQWKNKTSQAGIPLLAPWANRLDPDSYWANGKQYFLNPNAVQLRRDANGLAIHGLLLFASAWQIAGLRADADAAEVSSRLEFWKHPEWMAQFPFAHTYEMTYRLSGGTLEVRTSIENHSSDPMPLSIGFHPWFQIPGCPRDEWSVHLPVRDHYTLSQKLIPTGEKTPAGVPDRIALRGRQIDDVFGGVIAGEEFLLEGRGRRIAVRFGEKFPIAIAYAPESRNVVCFEPMTAITNAFNLAHAGLYSDLHSIPPGAKWSESFWIRPSGF